MHPDLKTVIELQQADQRIGELTTLIDSLPTQIQTLQAQLDDFIHAHEERQKRLAANQKERKELEGDIKEIQEKISRHKDQLYQVKTNEQYKAMLKEIEGEEANIRKIEDQVLEKMIEAEEIQKRLQEAAARLDSEKARVAAEIKRLETERQGDIEERERLQARRQELHAALSEPVLNLYERMRAARRGVAVAQVREGLCTACDVLLRPQVYNEVRANDSLLTCENCGRILYYVEPPPDASPEALHVTQSDFVELMKLQRVEKWDWPAVFATNSHGEIWPPVGRGYTKGEDRKQIRGRSRVIDAVADAYLKVRAEGGRFFIDEKGAYFKTDQLGGPLVQFLHFQMTQEDSRGTEVPRDRMSSTK